jgi:PPOX class probable F420-dependent enzyme
VPTTQLPDQLRELIAKPNPAVIATIRRDGAPVSVATWYLYEEGRLLVNMDESRKRLNHIRRDPRVSLTVLSGESWYMHVSFQGRVVDIHEDSELADIDRLAILYTGAPYRIRDRARISAWIEIDQWHGWNVKWPDQAK